MAVRTTVTDEGISQSSITIESRAKGAPQVTVKAYEGSTSESLASLAELAANQYDALLARYAQEG